MSFMREPNAEPIPGYRLIEPLGCGGFGEVWKCEAPGGLFKAIKFVYGNLKSLDDEGARADQEFKSLNRVKEVRHPFVLSMERIEVVEGELLIVMELADKNLHDSFQECQVAGLVGIPRDALLRYIRDAAEALDHMNEKHNLQHLDIKPRNLFLVSDRVKVADFGLVKHLQQSGTGILGGVTPLYAPPETFQNKITEFSDQYSLAIVYQEMLTGHRPFTGKNARQLAMQHLNEEPELRSLPEAERPVIARALSKEPTRRFPNCLAFVRALYNAKSAARPQASLLAPADESPPRPKTMADTMEDILLEQQPDLVVDAPLSLSAEVAEEEVSQLGLTVANPQTGTLRPTLVVALGSFGRRALLELRCRFLDRFGDLTQIPMVRFLYVDVDADAVRAANRGAPEVALTNNEICPLPLQPMASYRRRMLDHLSDWVPREKLYTIPRSLQTQGSRALGRLAFADNHQRFLARLRRELQQATHPDVLYQSVSQSGLALRDNVPRVYVIAAAGGGTSGLLVDLGYALKRLLQQMRHAHAEMSAFLFCGAPEDPATPKAEQANVYATLTELNHYDDPAIPFAAQYGPDGPRIADEGQPYGNIYLLQLPHRGPEALRDTVAHLSSYLFHNLTTPLGAWLDRSRHQPPQKDPLAESGEAPTPFRSFGTYAVWFPRGLMLRLAARQACGRLVGDWQASAEPTASAEIEAACARTLADPGLRFESICAGIEEAARIPSEGTPAELLAGLLAGLEEQSLQSVAQDDPANWARQALGRVREWVGGGSNADDGSEWRKSRLSRALWSAAQQLAQEWDDRLAQSAVALMDLPGRRVVAAEEALQRFQQFCLSGASGQRTRLEQQAQRTQQAADQMEAALQGCYGWQGGFSIFGTRSRRLLRVFIDHLAAFARQRLAEDVIAAGTQFFALLNSRLEERLRDLSFCRQRLRHLQESLEASPEDADKVAGALGLPIEGEQRPFSDLTPSSTPLPSAEAFWEAMRESATVRIVLPEGETDLEKAAARFLTQLTPEQWTHLDLVLQDRVLASLGGLHHACVSNADLIRGLARPLIDMGAECLAELLPITDVAQVEVSAAGGNDDQLQARARCCFDGAPPLVTGQRAGNQYAFLLAPAGPDGKAFAEAAQRAIPELRSLRVAGQADLMFCREQGCLSVEDLQRLLRPCRAAYEESAMVPQLSPHSRFDVTDWVPLDP